MEKSNWCKTKIYKADLSSFSMSDAESTGDLVFCLLSTLCARTWYEATRINVDLF